GIAPAGIAPAGSAPAGSAPAGSAPAGSAPTASGRVALAETPRLALRLPALPTQVAVLGGSTLAILGLVGAVVAELQILDPLAQAEPWPRMALLTLSCLVCAGGTALTAQVAPLRLLLDWPPCSATVPALTLRPPVNAAAA